MLYRLRRSLNQRRLDRGIAGILETAPIKLVDGPCCVVSMLTADYIPMYLGAIKSFYPKLGGGKVCVLIDRAMPQSARDTLARHVEGIEFAFVEDVDTAPCQRGGTWERLVYCLDRSAREYTIQLDADTLAVGGDLDEVAACVAANRAFAITDGFARQTLAEAAAMAEATPNQYIGIVTERALARYPGGERLHYVRASSGFAGFAKGGFSRAGIGRFHQAMEGLVGERWREWGSEQCGSNFAIANSPDPVVLPYPEYASFERRVRRQQAKFLHFIGRYRYVEGYYIDRMQDVMGARTRKRPSPSVPRRPLVQGLTATSVAPYLRWRVAGSSTKLAVELKPRREFRSAPLPGPKLELRAEDLASVRSVFVDNALFPPVWIPPERVGRIVDVGVGAGMSCLWWLANYWRPEVVAFESDPALATQARANVALNAFTGRFALREGAPSLAEIGRADILCVNGAGLIDDPGFPDLDVGVVVVRGADRAKRLEALGFRTYQGQAGALWVYRDLPGGRSRSRGRGPP